VGLVQLRQFDLLTSFFYLNYKLCDNRALTRVMFHSSPYLTLSILGPLIVYQTPVMGHGPFSHEKKGLKAQRLMQFLYTYMLLLNDKGYPKSLRPT
jgi:hypothetical protein